MIPIQEASRRILEQISRLGKERLNILAAAGRVLAEEIVSPRNIPPWDNSAMDGYAVRWKDIQKASPRNPVLLKVVADLPAGKVFKGRLSAGEAVRIMTGAPLPRGADTVVQSEETEKSGGKVKILGAPSRGKNIRLAGEDVKIQERVLEEGTVLRPSHIGMLASIKRSFVYVYQRPRVAILATGDELLEIDDPWEEGKIVNSNSYSLAAQVLECGAIPVMLGIARDKKADLQQKFKMALNADVIISSGGVSVGDFDFVKNVMGEIGNAMHFWQVAMRPGKPLAFGSIEGVPLFGLPGNPVSAMVSFEQFVRPSLLKMQGHKKIFRQTIKAVCNDEFQKSPGFRHFIRAVVKKEKDQYVAITTGDQGSGILKSMVAANGLIVMGENETKLKRGTEVTVQLLDDSLFQTESLTL